MINHFYVLILEMFAVKKVRVSATPSRMLRAWKILFPTKLHYFKFKEKKIIPKFWICILLQNC